MSAAPARRRAAVIGSGFGGLAAAVRLQAAGFQTTIFEARDQPGGRAYVYRDAGFTFDAGPTVITAPPCIEELFQAAGRRMADYIELLPVQPLYRLLWDDGDRFDYVADGDALVEQIRRRSPQDVAGYERFLAYSKEVFDIGYGELVSAPFLHFMDMVRVAPQLLRLRADRPVYRTISRFLRDERLRQAFSFNSLLIGGNPFSTSSIYSLIHFLEKKWGVFFARGGTGALVRALLRLFEELGGEVRLSCPVRRVRLTGEGAAVVHRLAAGDGPEEDFDCVVSNADLHQTYARLYGDEPGARPMARRLERMDWSMSLFVLYFGTDRTYPDLAHHTVIFGPRYREHLAEVFGGPRLPEDFSLYLHNPTVTDPSLAPPGCASFYVLSPVPHLGKAPIDWEREAPRYGDQLLAALERHMPDLRRHIVTRRHFTPRDFEAQLGDYRGSAFSVAPSLTQSAWFRPHNRDARVPGLYIVGAGTHPGAGVPGVINSAKATVGLILKDLGGATA